MIIEDMQWDDQLAVSELTDLFQYSFVYPSEGGLIGEVKRGSSPTEVVDIKSTISAWILREDGQAVGFLCVKRGELARNAAEISRIVVHPEYRRRGFAKALVDHALEDVLDKERGGDYLSANCVTTHPFSQELFPRFVATALNPNRYSWQKMGIKTLPTPLSLLHMVWDYRGFIKNFDQVVYAPERHWPFLAEIYENLHARRQFSRSGEAVSESEADAKIGSGRRSPYTLIPLDRPTATSWIEHLEKRGYTLCGIIPTAERKGSSGILRKTDQAFLCLSDAAIAPEHIHVQPAHDYIKSYVTKNYQRSFSASFSA